MSNTIYKEIIENTQIIRDQLTLFEVGRNEQQAFDQAIIDDWDFAKENYGRNILENIRNEKTYNRKNPYHPPLPPPSYERTASFDGSRDTTIGRRLDLPVVHYAG